MKSTVIMAHHMSRTMDLQSSSALAAAFQPLDRPGRTYLFAAPALVFWGIPKCHGSLILHTKETYHRPLVLQTYEVASHLRALKEIFPFTSGTGFFAACMTIRDLVVGGKVLLCVYAGRKYTRAGGRKCSRCRW